VAACHRHGAPIVAFGGGTSLAGQACNVAIVVDFSKYLNGILEIDPDRRLARVQPGVILDRLRDAARPHRLTFGPDPSTHDRCTLGGMIGNNSCGVHSLTAGRTADNVEQLDVLTYDGLRLRVGATSEAELATLTARQGRAGDIYRGLVAIRDRYENAVRSQYPQIPRRVSGYNLDELLPERGFHVARALVGTESTCALVLEATVRLVDDPPGKSLLVLGYPDVYAAADDTPFVLESGPHGLEGIDDVLTDHMKRKGIHADELAELPDGGACLFIEFGGATKGEADAKAEALMATMRRRRRPPSMRLYDDPAAERRLWEVREAALGATAVVPGVPDTWEGWEDSAVPPGDLGAYLREFRALLDRYGYIGALYGHFGDGCVHTRIDFDLRSAPGIAKYRAFVEDAADLVVAHGGSLSGEHGDGQSRAELLPKMFGTHLVDAFREFKAIWDPHGRMNPGKVVDPYRLDENLRLGPHYRPAQVTTQFAYPDDHGSLAEATLRCVGVGLCRRESGGTMCPSFMVTKEEKHSTRGRAHLLFEMLNGDVVGGGWRDPHVKEALDLCLACKGCKRDCPLNVDVATYKAEFVSHYYRRRLRPRAAYALGLIHWWARAASHGPRLVNAVVNAPGLSPSLKRAAGVAPERQVPAFAAQPFTRWFHGHRAANRDGPRVLLWPDTFTNFFRPQAARAAVTVLEAGGYRVDIPPRVLCCGRPLYDYGMLNLARRLLRRTLDTLAADIAAGTPVVGLEPSCVAVFRDELPNLLHADPRAHRLAEHTTHLAEFVARDPTRFPLGELDTDALVHGHCHHRAVLEFDAEERVLRRLGVRYTIPEPGCCGMAGSFGFETDKYDLSTRCAERALLPALRSTTGDTIVMADGFSCAEQIHQATGRHPLHLAEVLELALTGTATP
jgi:FAD/FMN-containing dehydrogenase/Fe-S oxidoreductase